MALTAKQEQDLIAACLDSRSPSLAPAVVLALHTGLRYTDIRLLRWSQVDFLRQQLIVGESKTAAGTGRVVPLNNRVLDELQRWATQFPGREPEHYVFPTMRVGQGGNYDIEPSQPIGSWKTAWARARRISNVPARFHDLRHTACTRMLEGGVPLSVVATMSWLVGLDHGHDGKTLWPHWRCGAPVGSGGLGAVERQIACEGAQIWHNSAKAAKVDPVSG